MGLVLRAPFALTQGGERADAVRADAVRAVAEPMPRADGRGNSVAHDDAWPAQ